MDSILLIGNQDPKLAGLLQKMGYALHNTSSNQGLSETINNKELDLIIIDSQFEAEWVDLCCFLRAEETTSAIPIVCLCSDQAKITELREKQIDNIEFVDLPYSVGGVVSKVAIQLRLRKFKGKESPNARLGEINSALRDLNDRFSRQIEEAKQIQESLLPQGLPLDARFEIAVAYQPLEDVGGDWYDVQKTSSGKFLFHIADATGHGLSAAFLCSMTKLACSASQNESPDKVLYQMNKLMSPVLPSGRFVTAASVAYDPESGAVSFARGGHPPALLLQRASSVVKQVQASGFAIGFLEDSEYVCEEHLMGLNDMFFLYTDGLNEAQNMSSDMYGLERASKIMLELPTDASAADFLQAVLDDFEIFRDGRILKDDVTAIVLKRLA